MTVVDALGRALETGSPAARVVSLVPSETESVVALAGLERLVGRTEWCEEPAGTIEVVPTVGGTKNVDRAAVLDLRPDLVLANQEENRRADIEKLIEAGLRVHVSFPRTAAEGVANLERLGVLLGARGDDVIALIEGARLEVATLEAAPPPALRAFVPIWREPWMTLDRRTYGHDVLRLVGAVNVFAERQRRYPLAADLGQRAASDPGERDTRYPRVTRQEVEEAAPEVILLPDEPYRFGPEHVEELGRWDTPASRTGAIAVVSGKDLFWYGVRQNGALLRLGQALDELRRRGALGGRRAGRP
ncbi:MAG: helical backbone metal receptor [Sandaracinaceae bacterium]